MNKLAGDTLSTPELTKKWKITTSIKKFIKKDFKLVATSFGKITLNASDPINNINIFVVTVRYMANELFSLVVF